MFAANDGAAFKGKDTPRSGNDLKRRKGPPPAPPPDPPKAAAVGGPGDSSSSPEDDALGCGRGSLGEGTSSLTSYIMSMLV